MPEFKYLGNSCGLVHDFYFCYSEGRIDHNIRVKENAENIGEIVAKNPIRYCIAITADKYQITSHEPLMANGFKKILVFLSSHNSPDEYLTFWVRYDKSVATYTKDNEPTRCVTPPYNCSVSINQHYENRLDIKTNRPKGKTYRKIRYMPIWYKIAANYIKKDEKKAERA